MNIYEYLQQIRQLDYKVKNAKSEYDRLMILATSAGAIDYSVDRVQNGKTEKEPTFVKTLDQLADQRRELELMMIHYNNIRNRIYLQIDSLPSATQARVLYLHYFEYKPLDRCAYEMNYSFGGVKKIFRAAIRNLRNKYREEIEEFDNE